MQSVYSTVLADWATEQSLGNSYPSAEMQSVYSTVLADWATEQSLVNSYPSAETQLVYSTTPTDGAIKSSKNIGMIKKKLYKSGGSKSSSPHSEEVDELKGS